jgi:hypothetical protein
MPNLKNDLINDTLSVDIDSPQTLSNKTLTTPTINGPTITAIGQTPTIHGIYLPDSHTIIFEGTTANDFETTLTAGEPTADRTVTLPDVSGTLAISGSIALGTDTTGNYVATIAGTANEITVTGSGSETAAITLSLPANVTISNNLIVTGDLTVNGNTTTLNTANLNVEDNFVLLNSGVTGSPSLNAGIEVERGDSTNVAIRWNETSDKWQFTTDGTNYTDLGAGGATISDTAPGSPVAGQVWFESDTASTYVYYDSHWIEIGASGTAAYVADTAPSNPIPGQFWYNSSEGGTYVYYDSVWVEVGALAINSLLSIINAKGDLLVGTADNTLNRLAVGTNGYFLKANSSATTGLEWASIPTINALDDIGDVSASGVSSGQVLQWNGSAWVGATVSSDVMTDTRNAALIIMDIGA